MIGIAGEIISMEWLWTWGGECFGYREDDYLWTYDGKHVGCFRGDELYAPEGSYLAEIKQGNRLVIDRSKYGRSIPQFKRSMDRLTCPRCENYPPLTLYLDHKDFPSPDAFDSSSRQGNRTRLTESASTRNESRSRAKPDP
jgi:4-fold beta flower protein